jgi:hypothetical protein
VLRDDRLRGVDAHVDTAQRVDHTDEALEVDDAAGVEAQPGEPLQGEREQLEAALAAAAVGPAVRERAVDLLLAAPELGLREGRDLHERVTRDREQIGARAVFGDVQDQDRVGPDEIVARGPLVDADHENVQGAPERLGARGRTGVTQQRGFLDPAGGLVEQILAADDRAAAHQHEQGTHDDHETCPQRVAPLARRRRTRAGGPPAGAIGRRAPARGPADRGAPVADGTHGRTRPGAPVAGGLELDRQLTVGVDVAGAARPAAVHRTGGGPDRGGVRPVGLSPGL